ncbi:MAG: GyrI-like domain-containing protein [Winogradskyella sp.]|nr:GyrI-like domain-containing protein [Winogradskyella sp.]
MKTLKYILLLLLILIIGFSIYIAVQPNSFSVTRTKTINAPQAVVYNNVIDFKNWQAWNSWVEADPEMTITLPKKTEGIGGSYAWEDSDGVGTMKTTHANPNSSITQEMQFGDFPKSDVTWNFKSNDDGTTEVTWNIVGKDLPFGFKAFTIFMGGMEKQIGPYYERSLVLLDSILQAEMKVYTVKVNGITEYGGGFYMYKTTAASPTNISQLMSKQYGEILTYMAQNNIKQTGMPFTIYDEPDANGNVIMSNAIPVLSKVLIDNSSEVLCGYIPKTETLKTTLKGNYTNLSEAWTKAYKYMSDNNLEQSDLKPFEIYQNDPGEFPNPADWITEIYIPIK